MKLNKSKGQSRTQIESAATGAIMEQWSSGAIQSAVAKSWRATFSQLSPFASFIEKKCHGVEQINSADVIHPQTFPIHPANLMNH